MNAALDNLPADRELRFTESYPFTYTMVCPLSKNNDMMEKRAAVIRELITPEPQSIIEFGGAYGNLGVVYKKDNPNSTYTLVDTKSMLRFAKVFADVMKTETVLCEPSKIETVLTEYDLFCTYCAISETPPSYREKVFDLFLPKCKSAMIIETPENMSEYVQVLEKYFGHCNTFTPPDGHSDKHVVLYASR